MKKFFSFIAAVLVAMVMNAQDSLAVSTPAVISVDSALAIGFALDSAATSAEEYTIEGYVINAAAFSQVYHNQNWYMADSATATASDLYAFGCVAIDNGDTVEVNNGDQVALTGQLLKYWDKRKKQFVIEVKNGVASFMSKQTCELDTISVSAALDLLADANPCPHVVEGIVSKIDSAYLGTYGNINVTLKDLETPTKTILAYRMIAAEGVNFTSPIPFKVKDTIQVYGKTLKMFNSTPELADEVYLTAIVGVAPFDSVPAGPDVAPATDSLQAALMEKGVTTSYDNVIINGGPSIKMGKSGEGGDMKLSVGAGTTRMNFFAAGWKGEPGKITITAPEGVTVTPASIDIEANPSFSGSFTTMDVDNEEDYAFAFTIEGVADKSVTFTLKSTKRSIVWGAMYASGEAPEITYDTLNVADAVAIADSLAGGKYSKKYFIEGYAVNVEAYNAIYNNQTFYLVDSLNAPDSVLMAFRATPEKDSAAYPVLEGDKLRLFGKLLKYVKDTATGPQLQVYYPTVEFLEEVEGSREIEEPQFDTITIARALQIGDSIGEGKSTTDMYIMEGYVTGLTDSKGNPSADGGYAQYGNQTMWLADTMDSTLVSKDKAFMVYQAVASDSTQITRGAKLSLKCALKNYYGTIENASFPITVTVLEPGEEPVKPAAPDTISVDSALIIGNALPAKGITTETYAIMGYVSKIDDNSYSTSFKNMTFWITNDPGSIAGSNAEGAFQVYRGKPDRELVLGNKVLVTTQIQKYGSANTIESTQNCPVLFLEQGEAPTFDTLTVDMAKEIADTLPENVLSEKKYYVIGYAANVSEYDSRYPRQDFYMVADSAASDSALLAFHAVPTKDDVATPVLAGDKVCLFGALQKYVADSAAAPQLQVVNPLAEILEAVEGDRTIPAPAWEEINVAQAMEIGRSLASGTASELQYYITGYVSSIVNVFDTQNKNETFWITDDSTSRANSTAAGAFEVYRGKPNTGKEIGLHAQIKILCKIKNYNGTIENDGTNIPFDVLKQGEELKFDTLSVAEAMVLIDSLPSGAQSPDFYVVKGYIASISTPYDASYGNMSFYMCDDITEPSNDLQCYRAKLSSADAEKAVRGAYVAVTGLLDNNSHGRQMYQGATVAFMEAPKIDTPYVSVVVADSIAMSLEANTDAKGMYIVHGYVSEADEYEDGQQSFYLIDTIGATVKLYARFANVEAELKDGQYVEILGKISHFVNTRTDEHEARMNMGTVINVRAEEGIEHIVLTDNARKIMIDGAMYIIRDGKMYDVRGAHIR